VGNSNGHLSDHFHEEGDSSIGIEKVKWEFIHYFDIFELEDATKVILQMRTDIYRRRTISI
jgi:hypothetical protein